MKKPMDNKEKPLQSYMLIHLLKPFDLDYKEIQIQLLNQRINEHFAANHFLMRQ